MIVRDLLSDKSGMIAMFAQKDSIGAEAMLIYTLLLVADANTKDLLQKDKFDKDRFTKHVPELIHQCGSLNKIEQQVQKICRIANKSL